MWRTRYLPLGVGLIVLVIGTVWLVSDNSNPAAGVLVGAGLAIGVEGYRYLLDEARQDRERSEIADDANRKGLDETRRLLYMALSVSGSTYLGSAELGGSIANSLAHHSKRLTTEEAERLATQIATGGVVSDETVTNRIREQIQSITSELGDHPPAA
jgi:hypothetical protein